uniref:hypothetical protein n=1 Tax=Dokdonella sp. TaxID=2291710 RepID=UPI003F808986
MAAVDTSPRLEPSSESLLAMMSLAHAPVLEQMTPDQRRTSMCFAREMFRLGTEVERQRAQRVVRPAARLGVVSRRRRVFWLLLELLASFTTLAGMGEGSTTVAGAAWYLVAGMAWIALAAARGMHGLWPLNLAAIAIEGFNLWSALR